MATLKPKRILIAPLDWGLGHTARCISIIRYILDQGHVPVVAGNLSQRSFIEETFGAIDFIHLEGYNISYSKWNKWAQAGLLSQLPDIISAINREHKWLMQMADKLQLDGIISDNRYGLFHPAIPSVILTHQLQVQTGFGDTADRVVRKIHYKYLARFDDIWVVDAPGAINLGGKLSHPDVLPCNAKYIGLLSRFDGNTCQNEIGANVLVLLSGPEPQRSELSQILWRQTKEYNGQVIFIDGSDSAIAPTGIPAHITYCKRLAGDSLAAALCGANLVICRSGYSTIMDLVALQKKAILIPTPGQTEQEYLGKRMHTEGLFYCSKQEGFNLNNAINEAGKFPFKVPDLKAAYSSYQTAVAQWLQHL